MNGWNPTHKNGHEWGMVYDIAIPTLHLLDLAGALLNLGFPILEVSGITGWKTFEFPELEASAHVLAP